MKYGLNLATHQEHYDGKQSEQYPIGHPQPVLTALFERPQSPIRLILDAIQVGRQPAWKGVSSASAVKEPSRRGGLLLRAATA